MNSRPYLDKLVTSPHLPKMEGQTGYCSRQLIPDLSCAGIHSEFEPKTVPTITSDGKMTKVFVMNAFRTMSDIQRGIVKQNAKEEIFKLDHRQYIDKLLVDMESSKRDKHIRRMKHWKASKDAMGFNGSFESAFGGEPFGEWTDVKDGSIKPEFGAEMSGSGSPMETNRQENYSQPTPINSSKPSTRVRINENNNTSEVVIRRNESSDTRDSRSQRHSSGHSVASVGSSGSHGFSRPASNAGVKRVKTHSRMALFNSLLDVVEPPSSPSKRFGSIASASNDGIASPKRSEFFDASGSNKLAGSNSFNAGNSIRTKK